MSDITDRLRNKADQYYNGGHAAMCSLLHEAAAELSALRSSLAEKDAEIERLRALLLEAANELTPLVATSPVSSNVTIHSIVINGKKPLERRIRDALENKP